MAKRRRPNRLRPHGFTMIEILVVISIIAVLVGMAIVGFRAIQRSGSSKQTKSMLANATSMLAEYDAATAFKQQPPRMWPPVGPVYTTPGFNIWSDASPPATVPPAAPSDQPLAAPPGLIDEDSAGFDPMHPSAPRIRSQAVRNTAVVLREISRMPGVKKMLGQMPSERTMIVPDENNQSILLDAWDNPILFVPRSGLSEVYLGDGAAFTIRSNKAYPAGDTTVPAGTVPAAARPFFASAGPDGAFGYIDVNGNGSFDPTIDKPAGDDNIYSFEN